MSIFAAFAAGLLSFFAPCGTFLLPGFFAYTFKGRGKMLFATWMFIAGFLTLFLPIGLGFTALSVRLSVHREGLTWIGGVFMIVLGLLALAGKGVHIPVPGFLSAKGRDARETWTVYLLGVVFGFTIAGCTAPLLAVSLAMASMSGSLVAAALILVAYALGLGSPLLALAALADRAAFKNRALVAVSRFASKEWRFRAGGKERTLRVTNALSAAMLVGLGIAFIASQGTFFVMDMGRWERVLDFNTGAADFLVDLP